MTRRILVGLVALFVPLALGGCAVAPEQDGTAPTLQSSDGLTIMSRADDNDDDGDTLDIDIDARTRSAYKLSLSSFDTSTLVLTGVTRRGDTVSFAFDQSTQLRLANLDNFIPTEPCRTFAASYNDAVSSGQVLQDGGPFGPVGWIANSGLGCHARIHVTRATGVIRAFRPVP